MSSRTSSFMSLPRYEPVIPLNQIGTQKYQGHKNAGNSLATGSQSIGKSTSSKTAKGDINTKVFEEDAYRFCSARSVCSVRSGSAEEESVYEFSVPKKQFTAPARTLVRDQDRKEKQPPCRPAPGPPTDQLHQQPLLPPPPPSSETPRSSTSTQPANPDTILLPYAATRRQRHCCLASRACLCVLNALAIVFTVVSMALLLYLRLVEEGPSSEETCVRCSYLESLGGRAAMSRLEKKIEQGREMCCAIDSRQMSAVLQMIPPRKIFTGKTNKTTLNHVSAHVTLIPDDTTEKDYEKPVFEKERLKVDPTKHPVNHVNEVEDAGRMLKIKHHGVYFIYSSLLFAPTINCSSIAQQVFWFSVIRMHKGEAHTLSNATHTCCVGCSKDRKSTFTGTIYHLSRGDAIYVEVCGRGIVRFEPNSTYLGLIMITPSTA